ncbi:hypothetical protein [Candidatus Ichthyocystis sparus]|uniref:hypothetical protein n=1 Tax=Candidatus Ichthyocystis sparus TaxID=1561004 RepID=UPI000B86B37A|nr:hypothetical protein [Candidatus Ichthyocystis sparus]
MNYYSIATCDISDNVYDPEDTDLPQNKSLSQLSTQVSEYMNNPQQMTINQPETTHTTEESYEYDLPFQHEISSISELNTDLQIMETQQQQITEESCKYDLPFINLYNMETQLQKIVEHIDEVTQITDKSYEHDLTLQYEMPSTSKLSTDLQIMETQQQQAIENTNEIAQIIDKLCGYDLPFQHEMPSISGLNTDLQIMETQQQQIIEYINEITQLTDKSCEHDLPFQYEITSTELNTDLQIMETQQQQTIENTNEIGQITDKSYGYDLTFQNEIPSISGLNTNLQIIETQQQQTVENTNELAQTTEKSYGYDLPFQYEIPSISGLNTDLQIMETQQQIIEYINEITKITEKSCEHDPTFQYEIPIISGLNTDLQIMETQQQQQQIIENTNEIAQITEKSCEHDPTFQYEIPIVSGLNTDLQIMETQQQQQQIIENTNEIAQITEKSCEHDPTFQYEIPIVSELNTDLQIIENADETIQIMNEHKYTLPSKYTHSVPYLTEAITYKPYTLDVPSCKFTNYKFGTSLLSCEGGIYSSVIKEIGIGEIETKLDEIIVINRLSKYNCMNSSGGKNLSLISHHLKKIFISLILEEVKSVESEYPVHIAPEMSIEDLRNASINNHVFFQKFSERCSNITRSKIKNDIYQYIPSKIYIATNINDNTNFQFNPKAHAKLFNHIIINSISDLRTRIIDFITNAESKFILFSFFGKLCGLYLQRQLLEEIKNIGDLISERVKKYFISPAIRSINEINLAIRSYNTTGNIPSSSASGFYNIIHQVACDFMDNICTQLKKLKFFYNESIGTISESSEDDILIFSQRLLEYFKYEIVCSCQKKLKPVYKPRSKNLLSKNKKSSKTKHELDYNVSCISDMHINSNHLRDGIYSSAIKNSDFKYSNLEELFLMEMKSYIRSADIEIPDFSCFYTNFMRAISSIIYHKLENLELELSSYILIPGNNIYTVKQLILNSDYHLNKFSKICEDELDMIRQCDKKSSYGISMTKCFFHGKELYTSPSSASSITPRRVDGKISYSSELLSDVITYAVSILPSIVRSKISNADNKFFTSALFKNFNGIMISKKSLQEISALGRHILQSVHENKFLLDNLKSVNNEKVDYASSDSFVARPDSVGITKNMNAKFFINKTVLLFEEEIYRLSLESIILLGDTITLPPQDIAYTLFGEFKRQITFYCITSFSEMSVSEHVIST